MVSRQPIESHVPCTNQLIREFLKVRGQTVSLIEPLEPEDCVIQTIPEASPAKWHLAHVTWFFETFCLGEYAEHYRPFDERYHYLFNSYYYSVGPMHRRAERGLLNRPLFHEVLDYRRYVDAAMLDLLMANEDDDRLSFLVALGLHHEQQHQELLLTDIKNVFFTNPLAPAYADLPASKKTELLPMRYVDRAGGQLTFGASTDVFCFDNETPRHEVLIGDHAMGNRLITNGEYRQFIEDEGYRNSQLWLADGWANVQRDSWSRPLYWSEDLESEFTLGSWRPVEPDSPVCHVSYYEADAFARWAGARLPTEYEWEYAADDSEVWGNTLDRGSLHPQALEPGARASNGLYQLWGDVWEWTSSPYGPYPRFKPLKGSLGEYNGKFMANQLVVRGGSCVSWASHLRASYRSFFYPHDRWQFLGFRVAKDN